MRVSAALIQHGTVLSNPKGSCTQYSILLSTSYLLYSCFLETLLNLRGSDTLYDYSFYFKMTFHSNS